MEKKGTVTQISSIFPPEEAQKASKRVQDAIVERQQQLNQPKGSRLGITTIVSTDSIRHMMRSFVDEKQNPLLWSSTYHAGEYLDPFVVS